MGTSLLMLSFQYLMYIIHNTYLKISIGRFFPEFRFRLFFFFLSPSFSCVFSSLFFMSASTSSSMLNRVKSTMHGFIIRVSLKQYNKIPEIAFGDRCQQVISCLLKYTVALHNVVSCKWMQGLVMDLSPKVCKILETYFDNSSDLANSLTTKSGILSFVTTEMNPLFLNW